MAEHPWCFDPSRDEAVRAAEDGRSGPLPTLAECIERQKHTAMTAGVKEGFVKADGEWKRLTDDELRQLLVIPKSVSASSAVEPENKGDSMATNGLRTERVEIDLPPSPEPSVARVTLEFSGRLRAAPSQWPWDLILSGACVVRSEPGESVRVVDEVHFDDLANMSLERDAAIRERDQGKEFWMGELRSRTAERDAARARVAELESAPAASGAAGNSPAVPVSSDPVAYFVKWAEKDWGVQDQTFRTLERAQDYIKDEKSEDENPQIVPLFAAPQPARGWLTAEERKAVQWLAEFAAKQFGLPWPCGIGASFPVVAHRLLAPSSPPGPEANG